MGKIIWLASYPKSGNTWLRAFLHNFLRNPAEAYDLNKMDELSLGDSGGIFYQKLLRKPVKEMTDEEVMILRPRLQEMYTRASPDNVFVSVFELQCSWSRHVESWTARPHRALHVMRYEDMLLRPIETFSGLVRFLGLPDERDRLARAVELSSFKALRQQEDLHGFRERSTAQQRFFREGRAGGWREKLTRAQVESLVAVHEVQMRRFGYWPVKDWAPARHAASAQA